MRKVFCFVLFFLFIVNTCYTWAKEDFLMDKPFIVDNIEKWRHPVKKVFERHKVSIKKLELYNNKKYPVFFVDFIYDPMSNSTKDYFNKLYYETLQANGFWDYCFYAITDNIKIKVHWDKQTKSMFLSYE